MRGCYHNIDFTRIDNLTLVLSVQTAHQLYENKDVTPPLPAQAYNEHLEFLADP